MPETFNCPNCGAPLDYKGNDPIIRCPYCSTSVVVPDNLRAKPSFSSQPSNFTLSGMGDMGALIQQARRIKDVKDLAQSGRVEEAVRLYEQITNASDEDALAAVQALSQGRAITLSNFSAADVAARVQQQQYGTPVQMGTTPIIVTAPRSRAMGCVMGCFVTGLVLTILVSVLVPLLGGMLPLMIQSGDMPDALKTALPEIITQVPAVIPTVHSFAREDLSFGGEGTGPGLFTDPRSIAVDPRSGRIYVADYQGGRVQSFDSEGKFITQWRVGDKNTIIRGMTADRKGNVFIVATSAIYRYSGESGEELDQIKADSTVTYHYDDIAVSADGSLYAVGGGETIVQMDTTGKVLSTIPEAISSITDDSELNSRIAVDGEGNIFLLGTFNDAIFKFGPNGKYLNKFGTDGDKPGQFRAPYAIAVDGQGHVYVSDIKGIQVFDNEGQYIDVIDVQGACFGMVFDDEGRLYITTNLNKILRFTISK